MQIYLLIFPCFLNSNPLANGLGMSSSITEFCLFLIVLMYLDWISSSVSPCFSLRPGLSFSAYFVL